MSQARWDDYNYAPAVAAAEHQGVRRSTRIFLLACVVFLVTVIVWADRAMLDELTRGDGRVVPSRQLQVVQSLEGGIVREILVSEGDLVETGQVLLRIDDTGFAASLGELTAERRSLRAAIARLRAEVASNEVIDFPDDLPTTHPELVADERELFEVRRSELEGQIKVARQQAEQRELELQEERRREESLRTSLSLAQQELRLNEPLARSGIVPQTEILRLRRTVNDLQSDLESAGQAIPRLESAIREAYERIQNLYLASRAQAQAELNQHQSELAVVEERISAARDRVVRTDIRSPVDGIVNSLNVTTIGSVVQPGRDIVEIVPIEDTLLIEARVRPSDVAFIRPGLPATVRITAYDYAIYGALEGEIERIGADTVTDEETRETYYRVMVRTEQNYLGDSDNPLPIIPGMVASVDILTGEKSVLDYILKPILRAHREALTER